MERVNIPDTGKSSYKLIERKRRRVGGREGVSEEGRKEASKLRDKRAKNINRKFV